MLHSNVVSFITTSQYESAITLPLEHVLDLVLSIDMLFKPNSSLRVTLQNRETKKIFNLYYIVADLLLSIQVIIHVFFLFVYLKLIENQFLFLI